MAPTTMNGSRPVTTSSGNSASGGSCDRSNPRAKNRRWARRRCVPRVRDCLSVHHAAPIKGLSPLFGLAAGLWPARPMSRARSPRGARYSGRDRTSRCAAPHQSAGDPLTKHASGKHNIRESQGTVPTPVIRDCPRYSARLASVVGPLDDLTEPVGVLRRIDSVGIGRRSLDETRRAEHNGLSPIFGTVPITRDCPHHRTSG